MFNIAVMKLEKSMKLSDSVKSIEIINEDVPTDANVTMSGWGSNAPGTESTKHLRYSIMNAVGDEDCRQTTGLNFKGIICLSYRTGRGACAVSLFLLTFGDDNFFSFTA